MPLIFFIIIAIIVLIIISTRQINEYEKGIKFTMGKYSKTLSSGWHFVMPIFQSLSKIDVRVKVIDVPEQDTITKDNISIKINAVIYYNIFDAKKALLSVERYADAVSQLAQTTMRNIVGSVTLDELLTGRDAISTNICTIVDKATDAWGVKIENVELKDIALPEEMKRVMAKVAEAEREKAAVITKAKGELEASENLSQAATTLSASPGALHLRTLSTINDVSSDQSNTIIFALPIEILRAFEGSKDDLTKKVIEKLNNK